MALVIRRSDVFPIGTTVKAFPLAFERTHQSRPPGTQLASATVAADGSLTFSTLANGNYTLWAEVGGVGVQIHAGSEGFTPPAPGLLERVRARRAELGIA
jgi:hypothetical protein